MFAAMRAGARGYVLEAAGHAEVTAAVRAVQWVKRSAVPASLRMTTYFDHLTPTAEDSFSELTLGAREADLPRQ